MTLNNRRLFLKKSSLSLLTLAAGNIPFAERLDSETTVANVVKKTIFLWDENSSNNGPDFKKRPKLELFIPKTAGSKKRAAIIICPGGGYSGLATHEGAPFAELFALHGIVSAVLTYRVAPNKFPAPMADATRAIRLLRSQPEELNIDVNNIGLLGFSAGGHLVATTATQPDLYKDSQDVLADKLSARPDRAIMGYPVISFEEFTHPGSVKHLLGDNPSPDILRQLTNQKQVTANTPPCFIFHTANDPGVPVQGSLLFAEACVRNKVPIALHVYPNGPHGVGLALDYPELSGWSEVMLKWLSDWHCPLA